MVYLIKPQERLWKGNEQIRFDQKYRKGKECIGLDNSVWHKHNKGNSGIVIGTNKEKQEINKK